MTKILFPIICGLLAFVFISGCASSHGIKDKSQLEKPYSQLKVMDLDEMSDLLYEKAREFKKTDDPAPLQKGLLICLSRPNEDGLLEKVISIVKTPLEDSDNWESAVNTIVDQAVTALKSDSASASDQVTYGIVLENLVAEFKPAFQKQYQSPGFETKVIEKIANADIEYSNRAISERKLNLMRGLVSPSQFAKKLIERKEESVSATKK
jgi:hypothetical protein